MRVGTKQVFLDFSCRVCYGIIIPTDKPMLNFAVDEDLLKHIDDFRVVNRINTRSETIRPLLDEALKTYEKRTPNK